MPSGAARVVVCVDCEDLIEKTTRSPRCDGCRVVYERNGSQERMRLMRRRQATSTPPVQYKLSCKHQILLKTPPLRGEYLWCFRCDNWFEQEER
jgi:hypothetical protein